MALTMRETPRSLTMYLLLVGVVSLILNLAGILSPDTDWLGKTITGIGLILSAGFLYVGARCKTLLNTRPQHIEAVLIAAAAYSILLGLLIVVLYSASGIPLSSPEATGPIARSVIGLAITLYLLRNVRRLAAEASGESVEQPPA